MSKEKPFMHFIDGQYQEGLDYFAVINPATSVPIGEAARGMKSDINDAVEAALKAFRHSSWKNMDGRIRGNLLRKVGELIRKHCKRLAELEVADAGKTINDANAEIELAAQIWEYYGDLTQTAIGTVNAVPTADQFDFTYRQPIGVIGIIIPWNFPFVLTALKLAPALAAGNTTVLKPAEDTPLTASMLGEIVQEADIPDGVINIVLGFGEEAGAALAEHQGIDKLIFTGSTEVGSKVMSAASNNITDVTLELGGKSANIIFSDANIEQALASATFGCLLHNGQNCAAGTRLLIENEIYDSFVKELSSRFKKVKVGDPTESTTHLGPIINNRQLQKIETYVDIGIKEGADLLAGGSTPKAEECRSGYFFEPTLFGEAVSGMRICQEEIFGPVISCIRFDGVEQALAIANDSPYGLAAGLCTRDLAKAHYVARELEAGTIWINTFNGIAINAPFLGWKRSGIGVERGIEGLYDHMQLKHVRIDMSGNLLPTMTT
jgi:acyl-CoA reductase-like NAD-dependent aldehyde dehydrogenase